jgi:hypothetical protein
MNALRCLVLAVLIPSFPLATAAQPLGTDFPVVQIPEILATPALAPWPGGGWLATLPGGSWDFGSCARQWAPCSGRPLQAVVLRPDGAAVPFAVGEELDEPRLFNAVSLALDGQGSQGGFAAVWEDEVYFNVRFGNFAGGDGSGSGIAARVFHAPGDPAGPVFRVNENTFGRQTSPASTALAGGGLAVAWESQVPVSGSPHRLRGRIFTTAGVAVGGDFSLAEELPGDQRAPTVAAAPDGGFLAAWLGESAGRPVVLARRYDVDGSPLGEAVRLDGGADPMATAPAAISLPGGGFAVAWRGERPAGRRAFVRLRRLDASGQPRGAVLQAHPHPLRSGGPRPSLAVDRLGHLVVAWSDVRPQDPQHLAIFASAYDPAGSPHFQALRVDLRRRENPHGPTVVADGDRRFTVFWQVDLLPQPFAAALLRGRRLLIAGP